MSENTKPSPNGSDWTRLLTDPDLVSNLGKLLQTYREVAPQKREAALLQAMREIKEAAVEARQGKEKRPAAAAQASRGAPPASAAPEAIPAPEPVTETPPFDLDLFTPLTGTDRRRYTRIKCYVAVEIHVEGTKGPIWGNLANVGRGGCMVETATAVPAGKTLEIGLWVATGTIWVKGVILSGVAARRSTSFGVRVKFFEEELSQKTYLREFLKFVEATTRKAHSENAYVAQLKA
jgi:hypothetical protein